MSVIGCFNYLDSRVLVIGASSSRFQIYNATASTLFYLCVGSTNFAPN